ncbi:MAG: Uncharacterized protein FD128_812 [Hyphomonadaceae bacterium]|nr:MAG: Uncharacterized protein FD128_812 [Hyphomonadaceae bacterium]
MRKYIAIWFAFLALSACKEGNFTTAQAQTCAIQTGTLNVGKMVRIPAGRFKMGSENFYLEERPVREASVSAFEIGAHEVTNQQFAQFVAQTNYVTVAERPLSAAEFPDLKPEDRAAGALIFAPQDDVTDLSDFTKWWAFRRGANWRHPGGPNTNIDGLENHPVVQVTYEDALAYAKWAGADLPTEVQWERAARGGLASKDYVWGNNKSGIGNRPLANHWQGIFPISNTKDDGYMGTAPIGCYAANGYGLYDMAGNVWELTKDDYVDERGKQAGMKTARGGSFLCGDNYCGRYRPAARTPVEINTGMQHVGFRIVRNP